MTFADSVAQLLEVQQLMGRMQEMFQQASAALAKVPEPYRTAAVQEIAEMSWAWASAKQASPTVLPTMAMPKRAGLLLKVGPPDVTVSAGGPLPSATQAIMQLLAEHEDGLTAEEIQTALRGRFQTMADKPERVIGSTLSQMRGNGRLLHDNRRFILPKSYSEVGSLGGPTLKDRVLEFFQKNGNEPATTLALAKAVNAHPNAIRSLFSVSSPLFVIAEGSDVEPNVPKLWRANLETNNLENTGREA